MTTEDKLTPNKVLMNCIDKLKDVVILGTTHKGKLHIDTSVPNYGHVNYMLSKSQFRLGQMELNAELKEEMEKTMEAENAVEQMVADNVAAEVEAIRPKRGRKTKVI